ncbi:MAG: hypothetical protein DSZ05_01130 [Sulfurospirillum sp.]|nr:MAG: hypothetical protein DSZ05_01130 [Sulfurospirillum sp.]
MRKIVVLLLLFLEIVYAQEFTLQTIEGKPIHLKMTPLELQVAEFPGKVIILDFFGANCPPCVAEMPDLVKFQELFGKTVQLIGIQSASQRDDKAMLKFVQKHHLNYPVVNLQSATALISYAQKEIGWNGALPYKLLYDFDGSLSYWIYGQMTQEKLLSTLHDL